ncbi:hypothetical protein L6452_33061 [Arctium lappa]|uniref:Uncharacterized protein n=1 Tax=Arctium lappa TaxID=4217 RepID=A0ACB8Z6E2_ARCLA|nr:hypothetical protein L6452_33061 [Arctium lappa]
MDDKIGLVLAREYDTKMLLEFLIAKYPGDETFKKYRCILGDIFKYEAKDEGIANDDCGEAGNKMNEYQADATCKEIVLSQEPQTESFAKIDIHQIPISQYCETIFELDNGASLMRGNLDNGASLMPREV